MGRLNHGVSRTEAESELNVLSRQILANDPELREFRFLGQGYDFINTQLLLDGSSGISGLRNRASRPLMILMITAALVLLIACANMANLLLARGIARRKEMGIRFALGASPQRIIMQMLAESLTLSAMGAVAGLVLAWVGVKVLLKFLPIDIWSPLKLNLSPDISLLTFAFAVTVISGVAFGLAPALRASRPDLIRALKYGAT